jgi:hypothetical protein
MSQPSLQITLRSSEVVGIRCQKAGRISGPRSCSLGEDAEKCEDEGRHERPAGAVKAGHGDAERRSGGYSSLSANMGERVLVWMI